jgi:hypothetical protein
LLEWCELRLEDLDVVVLAGEVVALDVAEVVEDAGGGRGGAGAVLVVEGVPLTKL